MPAITEQKIPVWGERFQLNVQVAGSGPPLVYFHPAGGLFWDAFLESLTQHYTVYAPEHPGTSAGDPQAIDQVDDLWDLVLIYGEMFEKLELRGAATVGQSFGGMMACEISACYPDYVSKQVLLAPLGLWRDDAPIKNYMIVPLSELPGLLFHEPNGEAASRLLTLPEDPEAAIKAQAGMVWALACTGKIVWPNPDKGLAKRLHRVKAPTLAIWGREDQLIPSVYAQEFANRIANCRVEIIEKCGHVLQVEQAEETSRLVLDFLRKGKAE